MPKLKIHPKLDPHLSDTYHLRYGGLFLLHAKNPHINHALKLIGTMASVDDHSLVSNAVDNSRSATEIVNFQFVKQCIKGKENCHAQNLVKLLEEALKEAGWDGQKIKDTISEFNVNDTVTDYFQHPLFK